MSTNGQELDPLRIRTRDLSGPKCATCGRPVGLVQLNGHSLHVEPKALLIEGGTILLSLHLCSTPPPAAETTPKPNRPPKRR